MFDACTKEDDGKRYDIGATCKCLLCVFIKQSPPWSDVDNDVAAECRIEACANKLDIIVTGEQSLAGVNVSHACVLKQKLLTSIENVMHRQPFLFNQSVVKIGSHCWKH